MNTAHFTRGWRLLTALPASFLLLGCTLLPPAGGETQDLRWSSPSLSRDFRLRLDVPQEAPPSGGWPWALLLDGDQNFEARLNAIASTSQGKLRCVVVAIGYAPGENLRTLDYTPTAGPDKEGGGLAAFLAMLKTDLVPWVEAHYPVSTDPDQRLFAGHSFGGLAVLHEALGPSPGFGRVIAESPSLWWDANVSFALLGQTRAPLPVRLALTMGSQEGGGMNALFTDFTARLAVGLPSQVVVRSHVLEGYHHSDVSVVALQELWPFATQDWP